MLWIDYFRERDTTTYDDDNLTEQLWIDYFMVGVVSTFSGIGDDWCVLK